ncbi:MAG: hydrogenase expression/formation protein HypE, partial [Candidatus Aminicenantes bacterium]|nr:hydrogenase expression/formation protein HypE [Candidatus Aminicenantes bacterium]
MKKVSLELGSGCRLMRDFIAGTILPSFGNPVLDELS